MHFKKMLFSHPMKSVNILFFDREMVTYIN